MLNEEHATKSILRRLAAARRLVLELAALIGAMATLMAAIGGVVGAWPF